MATRARRLSLKVPPPGSVKLRPQLSFAAGAFRLNADPYLALNTAPDGLFHLFDRFPALARFLADTSPVVIETQTTEKGPASPACGIRTGGSLTAALSALEVCGALCRGAILSGLPLTLLHLLLEHRRRGGLMPSRLVCLLEGHPCPSSLEQALSSLAGEQGGSVRIVHVYGVPGLAPRLLASTRRTPQGRHQYHAINPSWRPGVYRGQLGFVWRGSGSRLPFLTEEDAASVGDGFVLSPIRKRLAPEVVAVLEHWSASEWRRRTGFLAWNGRRFVFQLRAGESASTPEEMDFHVFAGCYPFSWSAPPSWGTAVFERTRDPRHRDQN